MTRSDYEKYINNIKDTDDVLIKHSERLYDTFLKHRSNNTRKDLIDTLVKYRIAYIKIYKSPRLKYETKYIDFNGDIYTHTEYVNFIDEKHFKIEHIESAFKFPLRSTSACDDKHLKIMALVIDNIIGTFDISKYLDITEYRYRNIFSMFFDICYSPSYKLYELYGNDIFKNSQEDVLKFVKSLNECIELNLNMEHEEVLIGYTSEEIKTFEKFDCDLRLKNINSLDKKLLICSLSIKISENLNISDEPEKEKNLKNFMRALQKNI